MRVVCIADTHCHHWNVRLPPGDLLIHAGDMTNTGSPDELADALQWYGLHKHRHKVHIAGNHDWLFQLDPAAALALVPPGVQYLQDSGCVIEGLRIWGSPVQPCFHDLAFNRSRGADIDQHWAMIPPGTDLLITHGPLHGKLDLIGKVMHGGCEMLLKRVAEIKPHMHVFGYIHEGYGYARLGPTLLVNAAACDDYGRLAHDPMVVDI